MASAYELKKVYGIDLNPTLMGTTSAVCAMFIYDRLIKNDKNDRNIK